MASPVRVDVLFDAKNTLAKAITALGAAFAGAKVVELATAQEDAIARLNAQLAITGDFSEKASDDLLAFANAMEKTTKFGDDIITNQLALAKSFGATNEQAKQIVQVAADMSASLGIDFESAVRNTAKTLGGFAGELGEVIPALKNAGKDALEAGEGINILGEQFAGAAAVQAKTFSGQLAQLKNEFSNTVREIGKFIIKNPLFKVLFENAKKGLGSFQATLRNNQESIIIFFNNIVKVVSNTVGPMTKAFGLLVKGISVALYPLQFLADVFLSPIQLVLGGIAQLVGTVADNIKKDFIGRLIPDKKIKQVKDFAKAIEDLTLEPFAKGQGLTETFFGDISKIEPFLDSLGDTTVNVGEFIEKLPGQIDKINEKIKKNGIETNKAIVESISKPTETTLSKVKGFISKNKSDLKGIASAIAGGREGAGKLITTISSRFIDSFIPGLGGALEPIIGLLGQSREQVQQTIEAFAQGGVDFVLNLAENAPVFIQAITDQIPIIIRRLVAGLPQIINSLARSMPQVAISLAAAMPMAAVEFGTALIREAPKIGEAIIKAISNIPGKVLGSGGLGGIPIIGDVIGGIGDVFGGLGFAKGGMVPDGYPNDTFPARLTSRELVIDRSLTNKLDSYLDGQQRNNDQTGLLNAILVELKKPMTVNSNLELDNRNFGQVILELNRDNERLEA